MSTTIRPELSANNPMYIDKHRYYELKHFCMQYDIWKEEYRDMSSNFWPIRTVDGQTFIGGSQVEKEAERRQKCIDKINEVDKALNELGEPVLAPYILMSVTNGYSYDTIRARNVNIPCGRSKFYELYREFFKRLDILHV